MYDKNQSQQPRCEIHVLKRRKWWLRAFQASLIAFALITVGLWIGLGIAFMQYSPYRFPAPEWGGYCEYKDTVGPILEPINAWTSLAYIVFSAIILCTIANYRFLIGVRNVKAYTTEQVQSAVFRDRVDEEKQKSDSWSVFFRSLFCGTPLNVEYRSTVDLELEGYSAPGMPLDSVPPSRAISPMPSPRGSAMSQPMFEGSRDVDLELRHIDYTVSVGDFAPSSAHEIIIDNQRYLIELRWSFRASKTIPMLYAFIGVELGFGSFLFHAWFTEASGYADFAGMLSIALFAFTYAISRTRFPGRFGAWVDRRDNLVRPWLKPWPESVRSLFFWVTFCVLYLVCFAIRVWAPFDPTTVIFGVGLVGALLWEFVMIGVRQWSAQQPANQSRNAYFLLLLAGMCIIVAYAIWLTDMHRILCWPKSWYQGHAVWHILTACGYYTLFVFYYVEASHVYMYRCDY